MQTTYCSACGAEMSAAAQACPKCGHPQFALPQQALAIRPAPGLIGPMLTTNSQPMSLANAIKSFFHNYANFSGRARRSEYWFAALFATLVSISLFVFLSVATAVESDGLVVAASLLYFGWALAVFIPGLAVASRRLHDADTSFGYYFLGLIPFAGPIIILVKLVEEGTPGANRFGDSQKFS
jgi:uncharacterized membrane protein YhaH (DUF805 family)